MESNGEIRARCRPPLRRKETAALGGRSRGLDRTKAEVLTTRVGAQLPKSVVDGFPKFECFRKRAPIAISGPSSAPPRSRPRSSYSFVTKGEYLKPRLAGYFELLLRRGAILSDLRKGYAKAFWLCAIFARSTAHILRTFRLRRRSHPNHRPMATSAQVSGRDPPSQPDRERRPKSPRSGRLPQAAAPRPSPARSNSAARHRRRTDGR